MNTTAKHDGIRLTTGQRYDVDTLFLAGWSTGEDHRIGYHYSDYFRDGRYLGPDADGVEPLFLSPEAIRAANAEDADCGYLVDNVLGDVSRLDDTFTPVDFGCDSWVEVLRLSTDTLVDGHAWFASESDAREYAAEVSFK